MHEKRGRRNEFTRAVFVCPVSTPSFCGFWQCYPYIPLGKCFIYLFVSFFVVQKYTIRGCASSALLSGTKKQKLGQQTAFAMTLFQGLGVVRRS